MENTNRNQQTSASWRSKRQTRGYFDPKKRAKADRERFRRGKRGSYKRLNDLFLDGLDTGRERRVYALVMTVTKGRNATVRYSTYNSHLMMIGCHRQMMSCVYRKQYCIPWVYREHSLRHILPYRYQRDTSPYLLKCG